MEAFFTSYLSFKFRFHSFNIFGVKRSGRNPPPPPPVPQDQKTPGLNRLKKKDYRHLLGNSIRRLALLPLPR